MKVKIEIDTRTFVRFWLVVIGFAFAILALYSARQALMIIGIAVFMALALNQPVTWIARRIPGKSRVVGTMLAFVMVIGLLGALVFLVIPPIVQQTAKLVDSAPQLVEQASRQWQAVGSLIEKYHIQPQVDSAVASIKSSTSGWAGSFGQNVVAGVGSVFSFVASTFFVLVLTFLMLLEGPEWARRVWALYTNQERMEYHSKLVHRMHRVVSGYVTGQLTISAIDGICAGIAVALIALFVPGTPANLAFPAVAICFLFSLIPLFGATLGGAIVAILLAINSPFAGLIFVIYFFIYQQLENNLIAPAVQARHVELSALMVLIALTVGIYVFGLIGGIISIPIAGCIKVLLEEYFQHSHQARIESEKPLAKLVKKLQGEA